MRGRRVEKAEEERPPPPLSHGILAVLGAFMLFQGFIRAVDPFL